MKKGYSISVLLLACTAVCFAQEGIGNLEFVQNKGQWDSRVLYKGELENGSFFLQQTGFTIMLYNADDLRRLTGGHLGSRINTGPEISKGNNSEHKKNPSVEGTGDHTGSDLFRSHTYQVDFVGANPQVQVIPEKAAPGYNNYFIGSDPAKWKSHCSIYQALLYKDLYPGIDVRYYTNDGKLKYDIIVHPGADPQQVRLKYTGITGMDIRNKKLTVHTTVGDVQELAPYAFQAGENGRSEINCRYVLEKENTVHFKVSNYSPDITLVIDPSLVFSTFTGSKASNWGFTATPGPDGSFFAGGIVFDKGFPTKTGAYQANFRGGAFDIGIIKFDNLGVTRLYATYIGGTDNETPHSLVCDPAGNLVVMGRTYSTDYPAATTIGKNLGGADIFITKITAAGDGLIGSIKIGGGSADGVNIDDQVRSGSERLNSLVRNYGDDSRSEVILDAASNIYVAASTQSADFPVTASAFQGKFAGGKQDGVVIKINPNCNTVLFASYLGGSGDDAAYVLKLNPSNADIYVAGATSSTNFPGDKTGVYQPSFAGGIADGFVSVISNDGTVLRRTSYFGTALVDEIYGIQFDKFSNPYIMGTTTGKWPVVNAAYSSLDAKQFISKLKPDLSSFQYSTTFGSRGSVTPNISPVAFLVDRCENVYVSGWGGWIFDEPDHYALAGTAGMDVTPDALKPNTDGRDFYFMVMKKDATQLLYGTFFGQTDGARSISEHVDGGTSRYDQSGAIYQAICANCNGQSITPFPVTARAWSRVNGTARQGTVYGCNEAAVKIAFNFAGVSAGLRGYINGKPDTSGCLPLTIVLRDTVRNAKKYIWNYGDGSPDTATTNFEVTHTYNALGTFLVRLVAIDSSTCNIADTAYIHVIVRNDKADLAITAAKLPPCQSLTYQFQNLSVSPPGKPFTNQSFQWDFGDGTTVIAGLGTLTHAYASAGTYQVNLALLDTDYCNAPDTAAIQLRISPLVKAQIETPPAGCVPYTAFFNNTSLGGQQFFWDFGDGATSAEVSPSHLYTAIGTYTIRLIAIDSSTCNIIDSTRITITVTNKPKAAFSAGPVPPQANTPELFTNFSTGAVRYIWLFGDGDSTVTNSLESVKHQYNLTGNYEACLVAINEAGCPDSVCHSVDVLVNPLLDVPNAFTPGRFGPNGVVGVKGFGIAKMIFRIYNRFGQKVFETDNPESGWDGTFNGNPQPLGVYAYTLDAEFTDGTRVSKKGDITLIR